MIEIPIRNRNFINWLNNLSQKDPSLLEQDIDIVELSYFFYRNYPYKEPDAASFLKGLMGAVQLVSDWEIEKGQDFFYNYHFRKTLYLKPVYHDWIKFVKVTNKDLYNEINSFFMTSKRDYNQQGKIFDSICTNFNETIIDSFHEFMSHELNSQTKKESESLQLVLRDILSIPFNSESRIRRLSNNVQSLKGMIQMPNSPNYYLVFSFFSWLKKEKYYDLLSKSQLKKFIGIFTREVNTLFDNQTINLIVDCYYGKKSTINLLRFVRGNPQPYFISYQRYTDVHFHGILLLKNDTDYRDFKTHKWGALRSVTGNYIDIYYCKQELLGYTSGYSTLEKFQELKINNKELPALMIWRDDINNHKLINFKNLNKDMYLDVIIEFIDTIKSDNLENEYLFEKAMLSAQKKVKTLIHDDRGIIMNKNVNYGNQQSVQFGENSQVKDITFIQRTSDENEGNFNLSDVDLNQLQNLINEIPKLDLSNLNPSFKFEIALLLQKLLESLQQDNSNAQREELSRWNAFLQENKQNISELISMAANITTIGAPVLALLGLSIS